jgi:glycosyltransferase involved in cell wall biosynthesis
MQKAKPHVILIAYHFPPAQEIGGFRPFRFYKCLKRMGYVCHVITASEPEDECPADVVYVPDHLRPVWEGSTKQRLSFKAWVELLIRKLMFPGHIGILWSVEVAARCREILRDHPQHRFVLFSTYPPLGVLLAGLIVQLRERIPWIADFRDPISGVGVGLLPWYARFWNHLLEAFVFRTASAVVANVEGAATVWRNRYPWAQRKLHVICNGFDPDDAPAARELPPRNQKVILHAGALYHGRNPNLLIESLSRLRKKSMSEASSVNILLLGVVDAKAGLDSALYDEAERDGWLEVRPAVPKGESQRMMEEADGLLLVQPQSNIQVPGKLFEYVCIGRPILALVPQRSAVEQILEKAGVPYVCVYADDEMEAVDRKLLAFLRLPTAPTLYNAWFRNNFNAEYQAEQLAATIGAIQLI